MSKKKLVAILTLLCFMFTLMPVAAMAEDGNTDVPPADLPTASVTPIENDKLTFALKFKANEVSTEQLSKYGSWPTDFVMTVNKSATFNANDEKADGYLSGQYDNYDSDAWLDVPSMGIDAVTVGVNEPVQIMKTALEALNYKNPITYQFVYESVNEFNCGVYFTPEFLEANPDLNVTLELRMYNPDNETEFYVIGKPHTFTAADAAVATVTNSGGETGYYMTLDNAIKAAKEGDTVTLLKSVTASETIVIDEAITLAGNGKTLSYTGAGKNARAINVNVNGAVAIKNLIIKAEKAQRAINVIQQPAALTIENVTATAANYAVNVAGSASNAKVNISQSTLTGLNTVNVGAANADIAINGGKIICNDQTAVEDYAALAINKDATGAKITATNVEFDIKGDSKTAVKVAENSVIIIGGSAAAVEEHVAYIEYGDYSYSFANVADAVAYAKAGETVKLSKDATASETIVIDKAIILDGNDKTLTSTAARAIEASNGAKVENLKIKAVAIVLNKASVSLKVGGTETLTATVTPSDTTETLDAVAWTSSNTAVASVDANGVVKGLKAGTATITAKAGNLTDACTVTVEKDNSSTGTNPGSGSGNSGSSSSSNKNDKNESTTTTTTTTNGTKVETTTETKADGTTVETVTTTTASGETSTTVTSTLENGSTVTNTDEAVNVEVKEVTNTVVNNAEKAAAADENVNVVGDKDNAVNVSATNTSSGSSRNTFTEPLTVSVPVDNNTLKNVEDPSKLTLAKVVTNADGSVDLVYMGGSLDAKTGTFTGKVDEAGDYILVEKDDLVKIELTIDDNTVTTNDREHEIDVAPEINEANRTMLPLRYVGEALGCKVDWNDATRTITITKDGVSFQMTIGEIIPGFGAAPEIKDDRTLVPIRYISEKLGANVIWDPVDRQVIIVQ